jgi:cytochrome c oxidase cbb3-type subunit IV
MLSMLSSIAPSLWVVWMMLIFLGICTWAFWPANRKRFEVEARRPLDLSEHEP